MLSEKISRLGETIGIYSVVTIFVLVVLLMLLEVILIIILSGYLSAIITGTIAILLLGIVLFIIRRKHREWYGLFEIVFGLLLGGFTIARFVNFRTTITFIDFLQSRDLPTLLGLFSAAYIIVRGMDNLDQSVKAYAKSREADLLTAAEIKETSDVDVER